METKNKVKEEFFKEQKRRHKWSADRVEAEGIQVLRGLQGNWMSVDLRHGGGIVAEQQTWKGSGGRDSVRSSRMVDEAKMWQGGDDAAEIM